MESAVKDKGTSPTILLSIFAESLLFNSPCEYVPQPSAHPSAYNLKKTDKLKSMSLIDINLRKLFNYHYYSLIMTMGILLINFSFYINNRDTYLFDIIE